jgi:hypothetical protein
VAKNHEESALIAGHPPFERGSSFLLHTLRLYEKNLSTLQCDLTAFQSVVSGKQGTRRT